MAVLELAREDIWMAVLELSGDSIWVAVLKLAMKIFGWQF